MAPGMGAVILSGGTGARMGGVDKGSLRVGGRTLLDLTLAAVGDVDVVVVGPRVESAPAQVAFVREDPPLGGPAAGLLTGLDHLPDVELLAVLAVDMPGVTQETFARLRTAAHGRDGAFLHDAEGYRQLAGVVRASALASVAPAGGDRHNLSVRRLLADLDLAEVTALDDEALDIDTWADLARTGCGDPGSGEDWAL